MNKNEYMEILIDYLNQNVSETEKEDILRDVEEMINEGVLNGKDELDVVSQLGSPKKLVRDLRGDGDVFVEEKPSVANDNIVNGKTCAEGVVSINGFREVIKRALSGRGSKAINILKKMVKAAFSLCMVGVLSGIGVGVWSATLMMVVFAGLFIAATIVIAGADTAIMMGGVFATILCFGCCLVGIDLGTTIIRQVKKTIKNLLTTKTAREV